MNHNLLVNIEDLLLGSTVEGTRIEYKKGWNPTTIMRSVCAFANDFENEGSGYVVVGVDEVDGKAVRPVAGFNTDGFEGVQQELLRYSNLIQPPYFPRLSLEETDRRHFVVVIPIHPDFKHDDDLVTDLDTDLVTDQAGSHVDEPDFDLDTTLNTDLDTDLDTDQVDNQVTEQNANSITTLNIDLDTDPTGRQVDKHEIDLDTDLDTNQVENQETEQNIDLVTDQVDENNARRSYDYSDLIDRLLVESDNPTEAQIEKYEQLAFQITNEQLQILSFTHQPKKRKEILEVCLKLSNHTKNFDKYIDPLLTMGLLQRTIPDRPNSKLQKYVLTNRGDIILYIKENSK